MAVDKNGNITINEWADGIGQSPYTGFAMMRNVDIHNPTGSLKIARAPQKISSTTVTDLISWFTTDNETAPNVFGGGFLDSKVYRLESSTDTVSSISGATSGNKSGGMIWKDYLIVASRTGTNMTLDAYDLSSGTWYDDFTSTNMTVRNNSIHAPMYSHPSENDRLYIGADNNIATLLENTTFDPSSGATFTFQASALDLPPSYSAESFTQAGTNLLIGASQIAGSYFQHNNFAGQIFPWDRVSSSFTIPTSLEFGGVRQLVNINNVIYFANGEKGDFYLTDTSIYNQLPALSPFSDLAFDAVSTMYDGAVAEFDNEIMFGISSDDTDFTPAGVYGFKNGAWRFLEISTGEVGENDTLNIGAIHTRGQEKGTFIVSWQDDQNSAYGIDEFGKDGYRYTGYKAYVESPMYQVATSRNKKTYTYGELILGRELASGQGVRISYRENLTDSFTEIVTIDHTTYGAINCYDFPAKIQDVCSVQFKIELTTGASSTTTPEILSVIFQ